MAKSKKEVWLTEEQIEYINKHHGGRYSEFCRAAVERKILDESISKEEE